MSTTLELLLVGFGHVAQRFVTLLDEKREALALEHGLATSVVGVVTRGHGRMWAVDGLDAASIRERLASGKNAAPPGFAGSTTDFIRAAAAGTSATGEARLIVVETTTLNIDNGQPAIDHIRTGLSSGAHVVTANKGPVAFAYDTLDDSACRAERRFLFEGAVMDGVPVFNLVRETLPAIEVVGFRGVLNSTTNYILTAMEGGQSFESALSEMQAAGIAEADPTLDVEGWDAAAKTAALANVLLQAALTPHSVEREGITPALGPRAREARRAGRRLKLVATAGRDGGQVAAHVALEELTEDDVLAGLEGQQNGIVLFTDVLGEIAVIQRGAGLTQTAYALLSDVIAVGRTLIDRSDRQERPRARRDRTPR
jgi:homoserine dehydrogenase